MLDTTSHTRADVIWIEGSHNGKQGVFTLDYDKVTAKKIVSEVKKVTGKDITISIKNKKAIFEEAERLVTEYFQRTANQISLEGCRNKKMLNNALKMYTGKTVSWLRYRAFDSVKNKVAKILTEHGFEVI